ncbi:Mismatch repair protein msh3 [Coemansia spiralis]|uniref:DNA mismatch repair protein n=2 Tax=Coemansia TaxID=4863 RepID=A0A9W8GCC0_9FUNG|nr:Mismatch repair protein msh3 [Coemansia umbellata]KAJ2621952.1 Mismatch repair protein msh3 [Coemansia sp. RSA 1358]KAJ2680467.1 Mismatch repair protein msh3 [Coemansia spiralis]
MSSAKRVQASLSSFFKPKQQAREQDGQQMTSSAISYPESSGKSNKRRRALKSDDEDEYEDNHNSDQSDEEYVGSCRSSKGSTKPMASARCASELTPSESPSSSQDAKRTLVKSVSDTTTMMQRLRMRIANAKSSEDANSISSPLATTGSLEHTSIQLVQRQKGVKYTPLEIQVLEAKDKYPDMLLAVEVGYKFRFFGEDARISSRILGIMLTTANNFYNASIPTPRLMVHVRRLVRAGYKVGIMRQTETAALKAISDNKSAPFTRCLAEVYTSGTLVEEVGEAEHAESSTKRYLLCITECLKESRDNRVSIGLLAVQITTGDVVYDCFDDGYLRSALETRLMHLQPGELLVSPNLSAETLKALSAYAGYAIKYDEAREPLLEHANRTGVRVAFAEKAFMDRSAASQFITDFYMENNASRTISYISGLSDLVSMALAMMIKYLEAFKLTHVMLTCQDTGHMDRDPFAPFHTRLHMLLSATTLQTLNIFTVTNNTSDSDKAAVELKDLLKPGGRAGGSHSSHVRSGDGSLFSVMDFTRSQFGRRMLRRWVAHPLVSQEKLEERIDAVEYLKGFLEDAEAGSILNSGNNNHPQRLAIANMHNKIGQIVDIERGLCRIHYGQANTQELVRVLRSLETAVSLVPADMDITEPRLLAEILSRDVWTAQLRDSVLSWRQQIDYKSAKSGNKETLFTHGPLHDLLQQHHNKVEEVEQELEASIGHVRSVLNDEKLEFKSISGIDYLIDIKNTKAKTVPLDWIKVSSTKTNSRFHTPYLISKLAERERCREALQQTAKSAYSRFLAEISGKYSELRQLASSLATLDALFSLAILARSDGYCKPEFVTCSNSDDAFIDLVDAVNPVLSCAQTTYVPNSIALGMAGNNGTESQRAMILTGPNAGGKSSLIRTVALTSIMAQCGSYVPACSARLCIIDAIFTRIGASDNLMAGESTFMVEMRETEELMRQVTPRSLAILDELGRGTSTHDGAAIAYAVLEHLVRKRSLTFFVTHYAHLVGAFASNKAVRSCHMAYIEQPHASTQLQLSSCKDSANANSDTKEEINIDTGAESVNEITFLYKLADGASTDSFGLNVARLAGLPTPLLLRAKERAQWMRMEMESKWAAKYARDLRRAVAQAHSGI